MRDFVPDPDSSPTLHSTEPSSEKPRASEPTAAPQAARGLTPRGGAPRRGDEIDVDIEKLVFGGDGLARTGGMTIFVRLAALGDKLRIRVTESRRNFARGEIVAVLAPGPSRRDARCRHFGVCGGCQLQHVSQEAQLAAKAEFVRESLRRIGHIDWTDPIPVRSGPE